MPSYLILMPSYLIPMLSHSFYIFIIPLFLLFQIIEGEDHTRVSRINLIDLAGSERSGISMTSGERLKVNH